MNYASSKILKNSLDKIFLLVLTLLMMLSLILPQAVNAQPIPILEYIFEECSGNVVHNTGSYPNADGRLLGSAAFSFDVPTDTNSQCSLVLDGTASSFVSVSDTFDYTSDGNPLSPRLNQLTVEAWIKPTILDRFRIIWDDYGNPGVILELWNDTAAYGISTDANPGLGIGNFSGQIIPNTWQHIAGVYDGSDLRIFINGQDTCNNVRTSGQIIDQSTVFPGYPVFIGYTASDNHSFQGFIDDLRIFPTALDRTQLSNGYFARKPHNHCLGDPLRLAFPLPHVNAYNAPMSAFFDHSGEITNYDFYTKDGIVTAFTGESAYIENGGRCDDNPRNSRYINKTNYKSCKIAGYLGDFHAFKDTVNYSDEYLFYDGHSGYDYPALPNTDIWAVEDGILCVATPLSSPDGISVWRNEEKCKYPKDPINDKHRANSWEKWHTFYIVHDIDDYTTWYLHSGDLEPNVKKIIIEKGYAEVYKKDVVAYVGNKGSGGYHLHFEVRKGDKTPIDPYGGVYGAILWEGRH